MKSTFSVIFYLKRQAVKKDGTVPGMGRNTNALQQQTFGRSQIVGHERRTCHGKKFSRT